MSDYESTNENENLIDEIVSFIERTDGLSINFEERAEERAVISQDVDGKTLIFDASAVDEVLHRTDADGRAFIQVNFMTGLKVLLTNTLVGFKPAVTTGLDMDRLPKVVTTPDLVSVSDAIGEALSSEFDQRQEVEILKKVYESVMRGGQLVGFELTDEKDWLDRLMASNYPASA